MDREMEVVTADQSGHRGEADDGMRGADENQPQGNCSRERDNATPRAMPKSNPNEKKKKGAKHRVISKPLRSIWGP
jgi:hypothetical protein